MKKFTKRHSVIYGLCVFLALVCIFCLLIPHPHECEGVQCQVCALYSACEVLWLPVAICVIYLLIQVLFCNQQQGEQINTDFSLVLLKVKLSD